MCRLPLPLPMIWKPRKTASLPWSHRRYAPTNILKQLPRWPLILGISALGWSCWRKWSKAEVEQQSWTKHAHDFWTSFLALPASGWSSPATTVVAPSLSPSQTNKFKSNRLWWRHLRNVWANAVACRCGDRIWRMWRRRLWIWWSLRLKPATHSQLSSRLSDITKSGRRLSRHTKQRWITSAWLSTQESYIGTLHAQNRTCYSLNSSSFINKLVWVRFHVDNQGIYRLFVEFLESSSVLWRFCWHDRSG